MQNNPRRKAYLQLHSAIILFGFTAILGRLITLKEAPLVWHRLWITCLSLLLVPGLVRHLRGFTRKELLQFAGVGCIVCLHWLTFYGSIKYSNVSVSLSCLATTALFTSFLEPMLQRQRTNPVEILLGLLVIAGIWLIFSVTSFYLTGIILGLISAMLASLFSTLNRFIIKDHNAIAMTFVELGSGWVLLSLLLPLYLHLFPGTQLLPSTTSDWTYILVLALACTSLAYVLALGSLKQLSAFTASLSVNLEPVYGIVMAAFLFREHEDLNFSFYLGTAIIMLSVFLHPLLARSMKRGKETPGNG